MFRAAVGFLAVLLSLFPAGCGVPGEPLPPLLEIPAPVHDLVAEQVGSRVILRFTKPQLTTEGTLIRYLDRIGIHGAFLSAGASPEAFPKQERLLATLPAAQIPEGTEQLVYELPLEASQRGTHALFALKVVNHREMDGGFSNLASLEIVDLPEPPAGLEATLTEPAIQLRWTAAERSVFGSTAPTPEGYEVYRAEAGSSNPAQLRATVATTAFEDREFAFGSRYIYAVRAFAQRGESRARTPESNRVEIAAVDRFPPAAPQDLRAVAIPGAVELAWSPNSELDLAGYNLYRRAGGGEFTRLNAELLPLPLFRDTAVLAGTDYRYMVKAVDRAGNEGDASGQAAATAE